MLGLVLASMLSLVLVAPEVWSGLVANLERVRALRALDLPVYERSLDEAAWDAGWRGLCGLKREEAASPMPASERVLEFSALASIDRGEYLAARSLLQRLVDQGLAGEEPNVLAYLAALEMDWLEATRLYEAQATAHHERWWGTVFYLAAQQRMFEGDLEQAAELYRRADAAYGVHGPYLGLGLVECLAQDDRPLEAWDVLRRALAMHPPEEALTHLWRFEELRLEGLRTWHERQPENEQVTHWLSFYEGESGQEPADFQLESAGSEVLEGEPTPEISIELELEGGRVLIGFDYRVEDLETGPFMVVDFYLREGQQEQPFYRRVRKTVLNQAPNGAFTWDAVPDGVRAAGWHGLVYDHNLAAIEYLGLPGSGRGLCMDGGRIGASFGLESAKVSVSAGASAYVQGGEAYVTGGGSLAHGRRWFEAEETPYPYSYLGGGHLQDQLETVTGIWIPDQRVEAVAVWLLSAKVGRACVRNAYLFSIPDLSGAE